MTDLLSADPFGDGTLLCQEQLSKRDLPLSGSNTPLSPPYEVHFSDNSYASATPPRSPLFVDP